MAKWPIWGAACPWPLQRYRGKAQKVFCFFFYGHPVVQHNLLKRLSFATELPCYCFWILVCILCIGLFLYYSIDLYVYIYGDLVLFLLPSAKSVVLISKYTSFFHLENSWLLSLWILLLFHFQHFLLLELLFHVGTSEISLDLWTIVLGNFSLPFVLDPGVHSVFKKLINLRGILMWTD